MSVSRSEVEQLVISKAVRDPEFRERFKKDPKGTLEAALESKLPGDLNIHVNEEDANNICLTLPHSPGELPRELSRELSEEQLSGVSGGWESSSSSSSSSSSEDWAKVFYHNL